MPLIKFKHNNLIDSIEKHFNAMQFSYFDNNNYYEITYKENRNYKFSITLNNYLQPETYQVSFSPGDFQFINIISGNHDWSKTLEFFQSWLETLIIETNIDDKWEKYSRFNSFSFSDNGQEYTNEEKHETSKNIDDRFNEIIEVLHLANDEIEFLKAEMEEIKLRIFTESKISLKKFIIGSFVSYIPSKIGDEMAKEAFDIFKKAFPIELSRLIT